MLTITSEAKEKLLSRGKGKIRERHFKHISSSPRIMKLHTIILSLFLVITTATTHAAATRGHHDDVEVPKGLKEGEESGGIRNQSKGRNLAKSSKSRNLAKSSKSRNLAKSSKGRKLAKSSKTRNLSKSRP
jgi:hypothetical protein